MEIHLLGIRHHGAGSCKRVEKALQKISPDIILLEGVSEADPLIPFLKKAADFQPPIAQLIYNPKNFQQAVYYPFTIFSPEWKTMLYAIEQQAALWHFDLPQSIRFAYEQSQQEAAKAAVENPNTSTPNSPDTENSDTNNPDTNNPNNDEISRDPLGFIAKLAGYEDSERWWELMFEQQTDDLAVFEAIKLLMQNLRADKPQPTAPIEILREAFMRQELRRAIKEGYKKIAVVCGAWHIPALDLDKYKPKDDAALLKGLPKLKLASTWIPWTYERVASLSGYGAGIISPAWYHFLYENPENAAINWLVNVADTLRKKDMDTSSAHLIEAVRLAEALASMRKLALPTLQELNEATIAVLLNGDSEKFTLIQKELIIGQRMGSVSADVPSLPLQQDIENQLKGLKLAKYQTEKAHLKASATNPKGGLDLRENHDRLQSQFLHRLNLLNIPFGREQAGTGRELSTKNEFWFLEWKPEFALLVIEASIWGSDLEQATALFCQQTAAKTPEIEKLSQLLQKALKANLSQAFVYILEELKFVSALSREVEKLIQIIPNLVAVLRYGDVRQTDTSLVQALLNELIPRIAVMLPSACVNINDDAAQLLQKHLNTCHKSLALLANSQLTAFWVEMLTKILSTSQCHPFIKGLATRLLYDGQQLDAQLTAQEMQLALSLAQDKLYAVNWLEGFLSGSGLLLIHNPNLWNILNDWVKMLTEESFIELLPLLRRAFSRFSRSERDKMMALASPAANGQHIDKNTRLMRWDKTKAGLVAQSLNLFFQ